MPDPPRDLRTGPQHLLGEKRDDEGHGAEHSPSQVKHPLTRFCSLVDLSQQAIGCGQQTVELIGPAFCSADTHSSVHQAAQAGQAAVTLTGHLLEG